MSKLRVLLLVPVIGFGIGACTLTPDYERPDLGVPEKYREPGPTEPSFANLPWWSLFEDETLVAHINTALESNKDVAIALARVNEAYAQVGVVRANQYPFVSVEARGGRYQDSEQINPLTGGEDNDNYDVTAFASFEIDLWGRLRRATEAARADLLAAEATQRNVTISLVAAVANTYFLLRDLDNRLAIARRTFESREESLRIIRARFEKGIVPELDVAQAEGQAADAQAAIATFERQDRQVENALRVLLGAYPGAISRGPSIEQQKILADVPAGIPLELLERRPDVQEAEQRLAAETARIGVARAARLPTLSLTGAYGSQTDEFSDLLSSSAEQWSFFGNIFAPIFNSGQLKSVEQAQRARTEQALGVYERTVLDAMREVDDALIAVSTWKAEHEARARQLAAAHIAARLSRARYDGGVVSYLEVLETQRSEFDSALLESLARQQRLNAVVTLYRALGGGWSPQP